MTETLAQTTVVESSVFEDLDASNRALVESRRELRAACMELAAANGSGNGIRRRILQSLSRLVEVKRSGATR